MASSTTVKDGVAAGEQAFREAMNWTEETLSEVTDAVRETSVSLTDSFEAAVHERPYTAIALAVGIGVALGFTMRR